MGGRGQHIVQRAQPLCHKQGDLLERLALDDQLCIIVHIILVLGVFQDVYKRQHVDRSIKNPEIFVQSNVMGTVNLLQRAKEAWYDADAKTWKEGKKYVQVSTDEVYGALGAEGFFMETTPLCPHSPYSASKASADMFVKAFHDTYGMPINITRCSNNYGPYQFPEKLIPLMINNVKHHKQLPVYGDGMQIRDWLYVEDHCKAIDMVANGGKIGEVYNVGGHNERPNIFIVKTVIEQPVSYTQLAGSFRRGGFGTRRKRQRHGGSHGGDQGQKLTFQCCTSLEW